MAPFDAAVAPIGCGRFGILEFLFRSLLLRVQSCFIMRIDHGGPSILQVYVLGICFKNRMHALLLPHSKGVHLYDVMDLECFEAAIVAEDLRFTTSTRV